MVNKLYCFISALFFLVVFSSCVSFAASGAILKGTIKDAASKETLYGANIVLVGTGFGASTDWDGNYTIRNVPVGKYTIRVTYIGYKPQEKEIEINSEKTTVFNFSLVSEILTGDTIVVSAQRQGQTAAINQQISSTSIKNIVSGDKIEELPEANAAEAVGRLPGISLQREGGEGSKVIIRGLAPKYNKVQIDGVNMASTDANDRSTNLSMISPYMLGGIEVSKSAMANQEADQIGGTVNFITKGAPFGAPTYRMTLEGGYNGLREKAGDFRFAGQASRRVLSDLVGISLNLDIEKRDRSSNSVGAGYYYLSETKRAAVNSLSIEDVDRDLNRYGGTLMLDYKTPTTTLILSNMVSRIEKTTVTRGEYSSGFFSGSASRNQSLTYNDSKTTILMNQLRLEQLIGGLKIEGSISYAYSKDETPEQLSYGGLEPTPLASAVDPYATPYQIPNYMNNDVSAIMLNEMHDSDAFTKENEIASHIDLEYNIALKDMINIKLQAGGMYKRKSREYDYNDLALNIFSDPSGVVNDAILAKWPWMRPYYISGKFPYEPFIDYSYDPGDFMAGEFKLERIPNLGMGKELIHYLENTLGIDYGGATIASRFTPNFHNSKRYDYNGSEVYAAGYFMPTITLGEQITFIPGFRYEKNRTRYTGVRGNANLQVLETYGFVYYDTTVTRTDEFFLPMIHLKYKPVDWFDIRASFTQTLARPDYSQIRPTWYIYMTGIDYCNPDLKSAKSNNYDLYLSFYDNHIGLFTAGYFEKRIKDLIFDQNEIILSEDMAIQKYGLSEDKTGQSPSRFVNKSIYSYINNPNKVKIRGFEVEWQSNFWYLPGLLKNIVLTVNYTYTHSEVKYPRTVPLKKIVSSPFGNKETIVGNADSSFTAPMLQQPDNLLNLIVGYDYEGFSIRASMQFKSKIFSGNNWRPELRNYTDDFTIYDLAVSQKLPLKGLTVYGSINNLSKAMESDYNNGTGYMSAKNYYGLSGALGIKYEL
jgi:TonB-dependent receptor